MTQPGGVWFVCLDCGAPNFAGLEACSRCGRRLDGDKEPNEPPIHPPSPTRTFSIGSILLVIVPIAVCLAVAKANAGTGIVLAVLTASALAWTIALVSVRKSRGSPMNVYEIIWVFFGSIALMTLIGMACCIAFFACCLASGFLSNNITVALSGGSVGAVIVAIFLFSHMFKHVIQLLPRKGNRP